MNRLTLYLLPLICFVISCTKSKEERKLFPHKVRIGSTEYNFHYNPNSLNRIYSVTISRPDYNAAITYKYYDEYFKAPEHPYKNEIFEIDYTPDQDVVGWSNRDSVITKSTMLPKDPARVIRSEHQSTLVFTKLKAEENLQKDGKKTYSEVIRHKYNEKRQLTESAFYAIKKSIESKENTEVLTKIIKYSYRQGKLIKASFYITNNNKPFQEIELAYDDNPGYLCNLPLEARFQPLELPYRDHNIISYKVIDGDGKVMKNLSYTCSYTYTKDGYPKTFTRKMLDGKTVAGYMVYKAQYRKAKGKA